MRLVLDLQARQGSFRTRGIGRFALEFAQALARRPRGHEIWLALNGRMDDTIDEVRAEFAGLVTRERMRVFQLPAPGKPGMEMVCEQLRESFLADLRPDVVHVASLFEDDPRAVTSIGVLERGMATSVTLHDLIPFLDLDGYLPTPERRALYLRRIDFLNRADLLLANSESSRREALEHLGLPAERVITALPGVSARFTPGVVDETHRARLRKVHRIQGEFILNIGGVGRNKNIPRLIEAHAGLPPALRKRHPLVVACTMSAEERHELMTLARAHGTAGELLLPGFVSEDDLLALYRCAHLVVCPSVHEGFGLPALEAMACGTPVIAANATSLPEVVGCAEALFDPLDPAAITAKMREVLEEGGVREKLRRHALPQAARFSWDEAADRAWDAWEELAARANAPIQPAARRARLAYVSPLPPLRTGIAYYSAELVPALQRRYDIDVITDQPEVEQEWRRAHDVTVRDVAWFRRHAQDYDRVLYHFGNSDFHIHMHDLLREIPGVVVLHDFFVVHSSEQWQARGPRQFRALLYQAHGYEAVVRLRLEGRVEVIQRYPVNLHVLRGAVGVVVHSAQAQEAAWRWQRADDRQVRIVPHLRAAWPVDRTVSRHRLNIGPDELVICSCGFLGVAKGNHRLMEAWLRSWAAREGKARLVLVGFGEGDYVNGLRERAVAEGLGDRFHVTGFLEKEVYRDWLAAADLAVQLRADSRGESSGTILDCMAAGLPTITNAHGSMVEFPAEVVMLLRDACTDEELAEAIDTLAGDEAQRRRLGAAARAFIEETRAPGVVAGEIAQEIERFMAHDRSAREARLLDAVARDAPPESDLGELAACVAANRPARRGRQLLVDVTAGAAVNDIAVQELLLAPPAGFRVEPVRWDGEVFRYDRRETLHRLGCGPLPMGDEMAEAKVGDVFLGRYAENDLLAAWRVQGVILLPPPAEFACLTEGDWSRAGELVSAWAAELEAEANSKVANPDPALPAARDGAGSLKRRTPGGVAALSQPLDTGRTYAVDLFKQWLGEGWSYPEPWGVWTSGDYAELEFHCAHRGCGLRLEGHAFLAPGHEELELVATVNGAPAGGHVFRTEEPNGVVTLPLAQAEANGLCVVGLQIIAPRSPRECGVGDDARRLGFAFCGLTVVEKT